MLDLNHLPKTGNGNIDYFYNTGGSSSWQTWEKPRGIHTIIITCIGAGGGGRSGWCADSATRSGGAGGGSGGFSRLLIPAVFLPDVLYVSVGKGGAGGVSITTAASTTGMAGANGVQSAVSIAPSTAATYIVCYANAGAGAADIINGSNTAGAAGLAVNRTNALISGLGQLTALAGQTGGPGTAASGIAISYPTTGLLLSGGGCGGGGTGAGGIVISPTYTSFALVPQRSGGAAGNPGSAGDNGISLSRPLMSIGGAGGGAGNSTTAGGNTAGGRGGNGGLGCGGGGGGAGSVTAGSGAGGNGGDGLVVIQCF